MMNFETSIHMELVQTVEEATHIIALKDYGRIKRGQLVEIHDYCGIPYVFDNDVTEYEEENNLLDDYEQNLLYVVKPTIR